MRRDLVTILQLGTSFAVIFSAFNSQGLIEVTVLRKKAESAPETGITNNSGYYSLSIIYFFFTFFNLIIPSVVKKLGAKWSQIVGASGYLFFMLTFFHLNVYLLYFGSAVLGASAALLWAGNGCYLVEASRPTKMERNSGVLWAMIQSSLITGGFFLIYVLRSGNLEDSFTFIYVVFSIMTAIGIVILILLPNSPSQYAIQYEEDSDNEAPLIPNEPENDELSFQENLRKTVALMRSPKMTCLSVLFIYSGLETTFYTGVYTSCLSATKSLNSSDMIIPFNALSIGSGQIVGGLLTGSFGKILKLRSQQIIILAFIGHMTAFALTFLCLPFDSTTHSTDAATYIEPTLPVVLIISFLLGISDALWQTQIYVTIGQFFKFDPASAFAIFKFFQSFSACISFFYSSFLLLPWQLLILASGCIMSTISFMKVKLPTIQADIDSVLSVRP